MATVLTILCLLIPLAYSPFCLPFGFEDAFELKRTILELGALTLGAVWLWQSRERGIKVTVAPRLLLPILYVGYLSIPVLLSRPVRLSACKLYEMFCLLVIFLCASRVASQKKQSLRLLQCMSLAGAVVSVWGLCQTGRGIEPYATLGNRNFVATFLMCATAPSIFFLYRRIAEGRWRNAVPYALSAALNLAALFVCKSKAAWLSMVAAGLLILIVRKRYKTFALILLGCALCVPVFPVEMLVTELSRDIRPYLWEGALKLGLSSPWFGTGLGQFFLHVPPHQASEYFLMGKSADTTLHAHNDYFEIFAETGLVGLVLFVSWIGVIVRELWRSARGKDAAIATTLLAMTGMFSIKIFFDMDSSVISSAFFFWLILGMACGVVNKDTVPVTGAASWKSASPVRLLFLVGGLIFTAYLLHEYTLPFARAQYLFRRASKCVLRREWTRAQGYYEKAMRVQPALVEIPFRLGYAYARTGQWDKALDAYQTVRATAPFYSNVLFNIAAIYRQKGDYQESMQYLREGFKIDPYSLQGHDIAREIFLLTGQVKKARKEQLTIDIVQSLKRVK